MKSLDEALYNCNWMDGNMQMKKLILIYRIRLSEPNHIKGGPFFVSNLELFSEVCFEGFLVGAHFDI